MKKIKVGIIGLGRIGRFVYLPLLSKNKQVEIVALCDINTNVLYKTGEQFRIHKCYTNIEDFLNTPIDVVICAVPFWQNYEVSKKVLKAKKHLLVEKPMALNFKNAQELVNIAEKNKLIYMVGYMKLYTPAVQQVKNIVASMLREERSNIIYAESQCFLGRWYPQRFNAKFSIYSQNNKPRYTKEKVRLQIPNFIKLEEKDYYLNFVRRYCHEINLLRFFFEKEPRIKSVIKNDNVLVSVLDFDNIIVSFICGEINSKNWLEWFKVYLKDGWIQLRLPMPLNRYDRGEIEIYRNDEISYPKIYKKEWAFELQLQHFLECIKKNVEPISSGKKSMMDIKLIEDIFREI